MRSSAGFFSKPNTPNSATREFPKLNLSSTINQAPQSAAAKIQVTQIPQATPSQAKPVQQQQNSMAYRRPGPVSQKTSNVQSPAFNKTPVLLRNLV